MKPLRIFRHVDCEGPGYLAEFLARHGIPFEINAIDAGQPVPPQIDDVSGLVFMGGPMSVNDPLPWIADELALIRRAAAAGLPLLGHCLGGQLIAKALGATVGPNGDKEIGWHEVEALDNPAAREWLDGLPPRFEVFHWHGETFGIPDGATAILKSRWCARQAFVKGNILAFQCHVEMTADMVREWAEVNAAEIAHPSESVQSAARMMDDLPARITTMQAIADRLYRRWIAPIVGA